MPFPLPAIPVQSDLGATLNFSLGGSSSGMAKLP